MKKSFLVSIVIMSCWHPISLGHTSLTSTTNTLRHGDVLCKVEVPYVNPGDRGEESVWPLGDMSDSNKDHMQLINSSGDTIAIYEEGKILHYLVREDTLFIKGEQSRRAHKFFSQERPLLRYPLVYGDSISCNFEGEGNYEDNPYAVKGSGYTVIDGIGCLTDEEDTLRHITRLHQVDEYIQDYGEYGQEHIVEHRYQWYCAGYRYAVMESVVTSVFDGSSMTPIDSVSYLFLPMMQLELAEDLENEDLLKRLAEEDAIHGQSAHGNDSGDFSLVDTDLSSEDGSPTIIYKLSADSDVSFYAYDIMGNLLASVQYENKAAGEWQECLVLSHKPFGNIIVLNIRCGEQRMSMKICQ